MMRMFPLVLLTTVALASLYPTAPARGAINDWEAGVRFGDNFSIDATAPIAAAPRGHLAVYFDRFGVGGYLDWLFALTDGPKGLKFYPGVGPELFFENDFDFKIGGNFGAEYSFDFPLTVGFDWRPAFRLTNGTKFQTGNWGLIARYRFGEGGFTKADSKRH
jgi:hypothetical protein